MRILFAQEGDYLPKAVGGAQRTIEALCRALLARGHEPAVAAFLCHGPRRWRTKVAGLFAPLPLETDHSLGYAVHRVPRTEVLHAWHRAIEQLAPDIVVLVVNRGRLTQLAQSLADRGRSVFVYLQSFPLPPVLPKTVGYLVPSRWLGQQCRDAGLQQVTVLRPIIEPARYSVPKRGTDAVMVGATWAKGLDTLLEVAGLCPDIAFRVYQSWGPPDAGLARSIDKSSNVELHQALTDFRPALSEARVLLVPSRMETWGRVVTEAQVSGIPAVARAVGGLPESVGEGGLLLPPEAPAASWAAALRSLWDSEARYAELSERALAMAARPELQEEALIRTFLNAVAQAHSQSPPLAEGMDRCSVEPAKL